MKLIETSSSEFENMFNAGYLFAGTEIASSEGIEIIPTYLSLKELTDLEVNSNVLSGN